MSLKFYLNHSWVYWCQPSKFIFTIVDLLYISKDLISYKLSQLGLISSSDVEAAAAADVMMMLFCSAN